MKNLTRVVAWISGALLAAGILSATPADARPVHHTVRVEPREHFVVRPSVLDAEFVKVRDGRDVRRMVRWTMDDGSVWLSPSRDCMGRRHFACEEAWVRAGRITPAPSPL